MIDVCIKDDCRNCPFVQFPPMEVGFGFTTCGHPKGGFHLHHDETAMRPIPIRPQGKDCCPLPEHPVTYRGGVATIAENEFLCHTCSKYFTVPLEALKKYPLWAPKSCLTCKAHRQAAEDRYAENDPGDYDDPDPDDPGNPANFG